MRSSCNSSDALNSKACAEGLATARASELSLATLTGLQRRDRDLLAALIPLLKAHLADDSLVKGWEVEKHIFKSGKQRAPLRAAARDIRKKAVDAHVRAEVEDGSGKSERKVQQPDGNAAVKPAEKSASGPKRRWVRRQKENDDGVVDGSVADIRKEGGVDDSPVVIGLNVAEADYARSLERLFTELKRANEQDFDAHLQDGLEWSQNMCLTRFGREEASSGGASGAGAAATPTVLASVLESAEGESLLRKLRDQRASGHRGRAIDRSYEKSAQFHGEAKRCWAEMQRLAAKDSEAGERSMEQVQTEYLSWLQKLLDELREQGEPDFDGMLRNGINFLEARGRRTEY